MAPFDLDSFQVKPVVLLGSQSGLCITFMYKLQARQSEEDVLREHCCLGLCLVPQLLRLRCSCMNHALSRAVDRAVETKLHLDVPIVSTQAYGPLIEMHGA